MKYLKILTHEIGTGCNLAVAHAKKCPISTNRYGEVDISRVLSNDSIVSNIEKAYSMGFKGQLAWQFYCEPLLYMDRIESLYRMVKELTRSPRFLLWTNGTLIGREIDIDRLKMFSQIIVSRHEKRDWSDIKQQLPQMRLISGRLDDRMDIGEYSSRHCIRPYKELPIDYYGNYHLCCADYMGIVSKLNVYTDGFEAIVAKHIALRGLLAQEPLPDTVPDICYRCCIRKE